MHSSSTPPKNNTRSLSTWHRLLDWAQEHYRYRTFAKDAQIPTRSGLLYLVQRGTIRLTGTAETEPPQYPHQNSTPLEFQLQSGDETFLGFVGAGQPFEIIERSPFTLQAFAHTDNTAIFWMYWHDLENFPSFRREILDSFRYQHQRKLLWLNTLGQRHTIERLLGYLTLLIEEFGEPCKEGYFLPFPLTHAQIASAIGTTRVTVTRLMKELREERKAIQTKGDNLICLLTPTQIE
jgi:CRP-like cAMP-binding protein